MNHDGKREKLLIEDSVFKYAGTPDHIPREYYEKHWGFVNKQLAFANWSWEDILNIQEELEIQQIKEMQKMKRYQLKHMDEDGWGQTWIVSYGLATLGRDGFLLKQYRTQESKIHMPEKLKQMPIIGRFARSEERNNEVMG